MWGSFGKDLINDLKNKRAIIPNLLSVSRVFAPFIIIPLTFSGNIPLTLLAIAGFAATDFLDGKLARLLKAETKLGRILDPIADKLFALGLLIPLIPECPLLSIPLILEGTIAAINTKSFIDGKNPKTKFSGKVKIWTLSASLISTCLNIATKMPVFSVLTNISIGVTALLEVKNIKEYSNISKEEEPLEDLNYSEKNYNETISEEEMDILRKERDILLEQSQMDKPKILCKKLKK